MSGSRPHVVVAAGAGPWLPAIERVSQRVLGPVATHEVVQLYDLPDADRPARAAELLAGADAVVTSPWHHCGIAEAPPEAWAAASRLRVIAGTYDHRFEVLFGFPLEEALGRGVRVVDTSRTMTPTVAEYCLAMILASLRDIPNQIDVVRRGGWPDTRADDLGFISRDLTGARVGLAGFGVINRRLCELLAPFDCEVTVYDPFVGDDVIAGAGAVRAASLVDVAAASEVFVVGIPPTPATHGIVDRAVIDALPAGAHLILPTRMQVMEQQALWDRVERGDLRVAVDVFDPEPPPVDAPFRTHPNVLPTPHIAGNLTYCHLRCFETACEGAVAILLGGDSPHELRPRDAALYAGRVDEVTA
jgi:phosphoglycerate dehydrogenase-like enzyme